MWSLVFATTNNDQTVARVPCEISQLGRYIGKAGDLRASIPVSDWRVGRKINRVIGGEGLMSVYAYRDDEIWWGGLLDDTKISGGSNGTHLEIGATSFEAYPGRREYRGDKTTWTYDELVLVPKLWNAMQGVAGGNIGVTVPQLDSNGALVGSPSGASVSIDLNRSAVKTYQNLIDEASNRENGYEWMVDVYAENGVRRRVLRTGYPQIGRPDFGFTLSYPGAITAYSIEGDAREGALSWQARGKAPDNIGKPGVGSATAQDPIMSQVWTNDTLVNSGYVLTEATVDKNTVTDTGVLDSWAKLARTLRSGPLTLPEVTADMGHFNPAVIGSNVRLRISDYPFPPGPDGAPGYEGMARCIGYEIDPGEQGARDVVKLIFENPYTDAKRIPS